MNTILKYIDDHCEPGSHCYRTKKESLDDINIEIGQVENFDEDTIPNDSSGIIAETNQKRINTVRISDSLIQNTPPILNISLMAPATLIK